MITAFVCGPALTPAPHLHPCHLQATSGEPGDADNFSEYVKANMKLYELRHGAKLSTHATSNYIRNELATALRKVRESL